MRQIFSIRFFAAIGAVMGLFMLLTATFGDQESLADRLEPRVMLRQVDLVDQVFIPVLDEFEMGSDGVTRGTIELVLDADRTVRVVEGTHGEVTCDDLRSVGRCVVVADLLGDAVVWFALVPMGSSRTVELPAIDVLTGDRAQLVNGWQLRYAPVLDRRCDRDFASYRELREEVGSDFVSIYDLDEQRIIAVVCTD